MQPFKPEKGPWQDAAFRATVGRELVHRRAVSEVFPTGLVRNSATDFTVSAQWPRWHVFYGVRGNRFDSALVLETVRQATILIAHAGLAVPLGHLFLMPHIDVAMTADRSPESGQPTQVTANVNVSGLRETPDAITAFRVAATFHVDGQEVARGDASARIVDPVIYRRFRPARLGSAANGNIDPVPAAAVAHTSDWNVVVGRPATRHRWPLRVDTTNPILFDHPLDHVPGVLLIEAVRQALRLAFEDPALDFDDFSSQFIALAELDDKHEVVLESVARNEVGHRAVASIQSGNKAVMRAQASFRPRRQEPVGLTRGIGQSTQPAGPGRVRTRNE